MKRYVLTKDKEIQLSNEYDDYDAYIGKTSDNILDLLEVGDMVEYKYSETDEVDYEVIQDEQKLIYHKEFSLIVAIWKRNGDVMRRYEVE